jgi:purine-binding chemotaxis protein CheW
MDADGGHDEREINGEAIDQRAPKMLIVFRVGELRLGIDVRQVGEVTRALPLSVPLPNAGGVAGMITLRGKSTAVIDLSVVLGLPCEQRDRRARMIAVHHNGTAVCLLVDQVDGLHDVTDADLEPPPPVVSDVDIRWLDYVARSAAGELIGVVDVDRILSRVSLAGTEVETTSV